MKFKVFSTVFVFFLMVHLVELFAETGRSALEETMQEQLRERVLGSEPRDLKNWKPMSTEQLRELLKNDDFLKKFSSERQKTHDKYKWYLLTISAVEILVMLLLALGCSKFVIGIVRRHEQPLG
ncbi:MAG: hypothetical protein ABJM11_14145 [Marinobacter sp.]|uniref:hypothetical protein n=1 Tax=Marinobacter sp. TaxID=50741 RepID=UPI003299D782